MQALLALNAKGPILVAIRGRAVAFRSIVAQSSSATTSSFGPRKQRSRALVARVGHKDEDHQQAGGYVVTYTVVMLFAIARNALSIRYSWLVRPRFFVYAWLVVETYFLPGTINYAVDIAQEFIDHIANTCQEAGLDNVTGIVCSDEDTGLAPASIDVAFTCDTYHHFEFPVVHSITLRDVGAAAPWLSHGPVPRKNSTAPAPRPIDVTSNKEPALPALDAMNVLSEASIFIVGSPLCSMAATDHYRSCERGVESIDLEHVAGRKRSTRQTF